MALTAYVTDAGTVVLNKVMAQHGTLLFVRADVGSGLETDPADCRALTALVDKVTEAQYIGSSMSGGQAKISVQFRNTGLSEGFYIKELGLFAQDPETEQPVLYCYVSFGDTPEWIAAASTATYTRMVVTGLSIADL